MKCIKIKHLFKVKGHLLVFQTEIKSQKISKSQSLRFWKKNKISKNLKKSQNKCLRFFYEKIYKKKSQKISKQKFEIFSDFKFKNKISKNLKTCF